MSCATCVRCGAKNVSRCCGIATAFDEHADPLDFELKYEDAMKEQEATEAREKAEKDAKQSLWLAHARAERTRPLSLYDVSLIADHLRWAACHVGEHAGGAELRASIQAALEIAKGIDLQLSRELHKGKKA